MWGQDVNKFALAFITPLRAQHSRNLTQRSDSVLLLYCHSRGRIRGDDGAFYRLFEAYRGADLSHDSDFDASEGCFVGDWERRRVEGQSREIHGGRLQKLLREDKGFGLDRERKRE